MLDKHLCASTVDVGSDGGMLDVTMLLDVDEGTSLDAEEEGPRSVSGSVGVVAKLLQSLPTAGVWEALDGTTDIHGHRAKVLALVAAGSLVALAASETTVTVEPCVVLASTSLNIDSFSCETQKLLEASERLKNPVFVQWFASISSGTMHTLSGIHNNFPLTVPCSHNCRRVSFWCPWGWNSHWNELHSWFSCSWGQGSTLRDSDCSG